MLSPCLASVTTDEIDPLTTDGIASVPKPVVEVVSKLIAEHSAFRDNSIAHDFGLSEFNARPTNFNFSGCGCSCIVFCSDIDKKTAHIHIVGQCNSNGNLRS